MVLASSSSEDSDGEALEATELSRMESTTAASRAWRRRVAASAVLAALAAHGARSSQLSWRSGCATTTRVGDDFCDCDDGRDERGFSGACSGVDAVAVFACAGALVHPFVVRDSVLDDGVADCCDGADRCAEKRAAWKRRALSKGEGESRV